MQYVSQHATLEAQHDLSEIMKRLAVKSNLVESGSETTKQLGFNGSQQQPLCPKPRRIRPTMPEFLKPLRCSMHNSLPSTDIAKTGILNIITDHKAIDGRESICSGCSPSYYSGSPPGRTDNPLVNDVQFVHQMEHLSSSSLPFARTKFACASASPI